MYKKLKRILSMMLLATFALSYSHLLWIQISNPMQAFILHIKRHRWLHPIISWLLTSL